MTYLATLLLILGLIFPILSWLTAYASAVIWCRSKRHVSPVFVPVIGPLLLTAWVVLTRRPLGTIALVWLADLGTIAFLIAAPRLYRDRRSS
ncbi:MAG: hypothetical protein JNK76_22620 [Planctomycetales bacterium]|nr:hypothetical protein [Planctomycetales bacterium]MBN8626016.1 hypothetical protein [Planctomycetota bacterium]